MFSMPPLQKVEPDSLLAKAVPVRAAQPQKQLKSVSDNSGKLDQKAERAVKLANYVLAQGQGGGSTQQAQAVIELNDTKYTAWVYKEANRPALMTISIAPAKAWDDAITITDIGLDGRVNGGVLPASLSPTKKDLIFSDSLATPLGAKAEGDKYKATFQKHYDDAVAALLKFYESK